MKGLKMSEVHKLAVSLPAVMIGLLPISCSIYLTGTEAVYNFASYIEGWFFY